MLNAAASRARRLLATRWVDDDGFDVVVDAAGVEVPVVPVGIAEGAPVASAPTPPVTGPLSERGTSLDPRALAAARNAA